MKLKTILSTKLITIADAGTSLRVFITLSQGGTIEHEPFTNDQRGLVGALMLAADVNAGKFFPMRFISPSEAADLGPKMIEVKK